MSASGKRGGTGNIAGSSTGAAGDAPAVGSGESGESGAIPGGDGGGGGVGPDSQAGLGGEVEAGSPNAGERGLDPGPAPVPVCRRPLAWAPGTLLPISTPSDDLLQSVTPDGLTLVFAADNRFYVADRTDAGGSFLEPIEAASGQGFSSLTVSADGLRLVGAGAEGFAQMVRPARGAPFSASVDYLPFVPFNSAVSGTPTDEVALEPVLGADEAHLVYSFVSPTNEGERPTIFEAEWLGQWQFGRALLGRELLWSAGQARRIPTGLSTDRLTLFYKDEVSGDFRAAWRTRLSDDFDAFQSLVGVESAVPDAACAMLYYSAPGTSGLDLFVARAR